MRFKVVAIDKTTNQRFSLATATWSRFLSPEPSGVTSGFRLMEAKRIAKAYSESRTARIFDGAYTRPASDFTFDVERL